jgi:hypothetical protein
MNNKKPAFVLLTVLAISMLSAPVHGYANGAFEPGKEYNRQHGNHHRRACGLLSSGIHRQTYLLLLSEKYAPDTAGQWKTLLAETEKLQAAWKGLRVSGKWKDKERRQPAVGRDSLDSLNLQNEREAQRNVIRRFDESVRSGQAVQIKAALSDLMVLYKKRNAELAKRLGEWKKQAPVSGPAEG